MPPTRAGVPMWENFVRSVEAQRHLSKVFRIHQVTLTHR